MSRASNTYVVSTSDPGAPLAVFTVKYEAQDWLKRQGLDCLLSARDLRVYRFPDGRYLTDRGATKTWTVGEFLAE